MEVLKTIFYFLTALSILIVIHELGHYWTARMFKMRVEIFSLFLGKRLFGIKRGDTDWRISAIPLGGYVKIAGMMDESLDEEQMKQPPQPWEFRSKPRWQRLIVMLGGVTMNVILGMILFTVIKFVYGDEKIPMSAFTNGMEVPVDHPLYGFGFRTGDKIITYKGDTVHYYNEIATPAFLVDRNKTFGVMRNGSMVEIAMPNDYLKTYQAEVGGPVMPMNIPPMLQIEGDSIMDSLTKKFVPTPAKAAGLMDGDLVTHVDSMPIQFFSQFREAVKAHKGTAMRLTVQRKGQTLELTATPTKEGKLYVSSKLDSTLFQHIDYSFGEALVEGPKTGVMALVRQAKFFVSMGSGNASARKNMGGLLKIATTIKQGVDEGGFQNFLGLMAAISMGLAFMNVLPIPALDGGHVLILLIESIIRRDLNEKFKMRLIQVGFFLVLALIVLLLFKDTLEVFFGIS